MRHTKPRLPIRSDNHNVLPILWPVFESCWAEKREERWPAARITEYIEETFDTSPSTVNDVSRDLAKLTVVEEA